MIKWLKQLFSRQRTAESEAGAHNRICPSAPLPLHPESLEYVTTSSGFRYRILDTSIEAGYDAAACPSAAW